MPTVTAGRAITHAGGWRPLPPGRGGGGGAPPTPRTDTPDTVHALGGGPTGAAREAAAGTDGPAAVSARLSYASPPHGGPCHPLASQRKQSRRATAPQSPPSSTPLGRSGWRVCPAGHGGTGRACRLSGTRTERTRLSQTPPSCAVDTCRRRHAAQLRQQRASRPVLRKCRTHASARGRVMWIKRTTGAAVVLVDLRGMHAVVRHAVAR